MKRNFTLSPPSAFLSVLLLFATLFVVNSNLRAQDCNLQFNDPSQNVTVNCTDALPEFAPVSASNVCCDGASVQSFVSQTGSPISVCTLSTANGPGLDWAFWLPGVSSASEAWTFVGDGHLEEYADGSAHLWGTIANAADPSLQFEASVWFQNGQNWADWSAQGRGYKDDLSLAGATHQDWTYYEMVQGFSVLDGIGALEGSHLELTHKPANYYFGFQSGMAANNKNSNEGFSGWMFYNGTYNGQTLSGHGDINVDKSCETIDSNCASTVYTQFNRASDNCGNTAFSTQTITVVDNTAPVVDPYEAMISLQCDFAAGTFITATDDCSSVSISYTDEVVEEGCNGSIIRHYVLTDGCGNETTVDQTIDLYGAGVPEFTSFPADLNLECDQANGLADPEVLYNDGCSNTVLSFTDEIIPGSCGGNYILARTYTLTDDCDNSVSQVWTVNVSDTTAPVLYNVPEDITINCGDEIPDALVFALDNCSAAPAVGVNATTEQLECGYLFIRTWFTADECGNEVSASQTITVLDDVAPFFTQVPDDITVACGTTAEIPMAVAEDECSTVSVEYVDTPLTSGCSGSFIRTYTATDGCGNTAEASHLVTYTDDNAPQFINFPADVNVNCNEVPVAEDANVTYADNCGSVSVTFDEVTVAGSCPNSYILERTWTITDECGNATSQTWMVTVADTEGPVLFGVPEDVTINCGEDISDAVVIAFDNCSSDIIVSATAETQNTDCGYLFIRTWTASDECGNETSVSQTITVEDIEAPDFTFLPLDIEVECGDAYELEMATASDACSSVSVDYIDTPLNDCAGSFVRTFTATDGCGNTSTFDQYIIIVDTTAPTFSFVPADVQASCGAEFPFEMATADDGCSDVTVTYTDDQGIGCSGSIVRTFTAMDACGNTATAVQTISVVDETAPEAIDFPADLTLQCSVEIPTAESANVTFADNCSDVNVEFFEDILPGECPNNQTIIRTWIADDACGNRTVRTWTITVVDDLGPEFIGVPADSLLECGVDDLPALPEVTAVDNCSGDVPVSYEETEETSDCGYIITRTWSATDECGNVSTVSQVLAFEDHQNPYFINVPEDISVGCNDPIPPVQMPTALDACSGELPVFYAEGVYPGTCPGQSIIQRIFRTFDNCGNYAIVAQTIVVGDNQGPVFDPYQPQIQMPCSDHDGVYVTAQDDCNQFTITYTDEVITGGCAGAVLRQYIATDACNNASVVNQVILLDDVDAPQFLTFPSDVTVQCSEIPAAEDAGITYADDCSSVTMSFDESQVEGTCANEYTLVRTWTLTDGCGNAQSQTWTINVFDNTAPVLYGVPEDATIECGQDVPDAIVFAQDNCSGLTPVGVTAETIDNGCGSTLVRTFFSIDDCGNETSMTQNVYFVDTTAPVLSDAPADLVLACGDALPEAPAITATDACEGDVFVSFDEQSIDNGGVCLSTFRTWCAVDCAGNLACHTQTISFESPAAGMRVTQNGANAVRISFRIPEENRATLKLMDLSGKQVDLIYSGNVTSNQDYMIDYNTENLAAGVYIVTMTDGTTSLTKKLFVEH